jgi:hypothetical protein
MNLKRIAKNKGKPQSNKLCPSRNMNRKVSHVMLKSSSEMRRLTVRLNREENQIKNPGEIEKEGSNPVSMRKAPTPPIHLFIQNTINAKRKFQ